MHACLAARIEPGADQMRVRVAAKDKHLKKEQTGRPDRRTSAVPGQNILGDHRLRLEQKEAGKENSQRIPGHHRRWRRVQSDTKRRTRAI
jgi:hypothetical protein